MKNISHLRSVRIWVLFFGFTFCLGLAGCKKEPKVISRISGIEAEYDLALPLVHSSFDAARIINLSAVKAYVQQDPDKLIKAVYEGKVFSRAASSLIRIDNQDLVLNQSVPSAAAAAFNLGTIDSFSIGGNHEWVFQYPSHQGFELDSIWIKSGLLQLNVSSPLPHHVRMDINLESLSEQGQSKMFSMAGNYTGVTPVDLTGNIDLAKTSVNLAQGLKGNNTFKLSYTLTVVRASSDPVVAGAPLSLTLQTRNVQFGGIFGFLGQFTVNIPQDSLELGIFRSYNKGSITLADPYVRLRIINEMGMSLGGSFDALYGSSKFAGTKSIFGSAIPNPLTISRPGISSIGGTAITDFEATKSNSNLQSVVNDIPRFLVYSMKLTTNPNGNIEKNFLLDTSKISLEALVKIPMWGTATDFDIQDSGVINLPDPIREIEQASLRLVMDNGFPIEADVQVYFLDSAWNHIDSALSQGTRIIASGELDAQGKVIKPVRQVNDIDLTGARWQNLVQKRASRVIVRGGFSTSKKGSQEVKFYSDYKLDISVGLRIKLKAFIQR